MSRQKSALIHRMTSVSEAWEKSGDNRSIFLKCYTMMTANMLKAIDTGRFEDNAWVEKLLHRFADYYFEALSCYDCGDRVPLVWREVHEAAAHKKLHVMQHLLLGVNAHINYDLVLTLDEILHGEWKRLGEEKRLSRYRDHCMVNSIIGETIDSVQDEVIEDAAPYMDIVDKLLGRQDERLLIALISDWREEVWNEAQEFLKCEEETERTRLTTKLENRVLRKARWMHL